jgi:CheY-like chemotaxis protein/predicted regulator of Ras-like GTPase activity (Roadblock/LC7/MglB family)
VSSKRILVVDDDPDLLFLVAHGIKSLQSGYQVTTAVNGAVALQQAQKQKFDLIVTDYMMPEMTGLELIRQLRQTAPDTQFILMTAHYETQRLRNTVDNMELSGFVSKPFTMPELLESVKRIINQTSTTSEPSPPEQTVPKATILELLQTLRRQIGAHHVLLVNADGLPVQIAGGIERAKALRLASFVSTNFLAIAELATLFGDNESVFKSSYYEGNKYNIYVHDINGNFFLAVVINAENKPGSVWFYTRQTATELALVLPSVELPDTDQTIATDFDNLFGNKKDSSND